MKDQKWKNKIKKISLFSILIILYTVFIFGGGVFVGFANRPIVNAISGVTGKEAPFETNADFDLYWKAWKLIDEKSTYANKASPQERIYASIKGMLASLGDPYTNFLTPEENELFQSDVSGEFEGVGIEITTKDGILTVVSPLKGTPAYKAGILAGDKILKINEESTEGMSTDRAVELMRGKKGTAVEVTVYREGINEPLKITITRDKINIPTVDTLSYPKEKTFVIKLYNFSAQSPQLFSQAINQYQKSGYPNLILDLRNNPGGYLDAAVSIAGWFLPQNEVVVKEIGKDESSVDVHKSTGPGNVKPKKMYIIINKGSASASEILAGALSENGIATLVGEKSFGKGSVQELIPLSNNTAIKITIAKWYTPNGVSISDEGLTPKIEIKGDLEDSKNSKDNVIEEIIKLINNQ